ncbi:PP2C family protein-serine/threonine phosphatase [Blastococcus sp. SYSU D00695]
MRRSTTRIHALPLGALAVVVATDLALGREQVLISLVAIVPMVAAVLLGRRATATYALLAVLTAVLLGVYDDQYTSAAVPAQLARIVGVALGGLVALAACTIRLRREQQVLRMTAEAATVRARITVAEAIQRSLLADLPALPRLETAVRYLPATRDAQIGGDWYDAFGTSDGGSMVVVGDVAGHDAPAAATMAQARGMLRALAQEVLGSPAAVLGALDRALVHLRVDTLVTVVAAKVVERRAGDGLLLRWSNAGHPAPVLVRADGSVELLARTPDRLLGVGTSVRRTDHALDLAPGDTLLLYTDGLVEVPGRTLDAGTDALLAALEGAAGRPLEQVCDELLAGPGRHHHDDVALLALRVHA